MIRSMTGFGSTERVWEQWTIRAEARSVNHAQLNVHVHLPMVLRFKESELTKMVEGRLSRGHVHLSVGCSPAENAIDLLVDRERLRSYVRLAKEAAAAEGVAASVEVGALMSLPGVASFEGLSTQVWEALWPEALNAAQEAVDEMVRMREAEGQNLAGQLLAICTDARKRTEAVAAGIGESVRQYRARHAERIKQLLQGVDVPFDENAIARQLAVLAERSDVSEEIARMRSHLDQFETALQSQGGPVGKKLEFLGQEMLREANTMVAKLPTSELVQQAIEIKLEVNRLLEQVRNVE